MRRKPHCAYAINHLLVRRWRHRKTILFGMIEARPKALLAEIAAQHGFEILTYKVTPDPVPPLVSAPPKVSSAEGVRRFKGTSSRPE